MRHLQEYRLRWRNDRGLSLLRLSFRYGREAKMLLCCLREKTINVKGAQVQIIARRTRLPQGFHVVHSADNFIRVDADAQLSPCEMFAGKDQTSEFRPVHIRLGPARRDRARV